MPEKQADGRKRQQHYTVLDLARFLLDKDDCFAAYDPQAVACLERCSLRDDCRQITVKRIGLQKTKAELVEILGLGAKLRPKGKTKRKENSMPRIVEEDDETEPTPKPPRGGDKGDKDVREVKPDSEDDESEMKGLGAGEEDDEDLRPRKPVVSAKPAKPAAPSKEDEQPRSTKAAPKPAEPRTEEPSAKPASGTKDVYLAYAKHHADAGSMFRRLSETYGTLADLFEGMAKKMSSPK